MKRKMNLKLCVSVLAGLMAVSAAGCGESMEVKKADELVQPGQYSQESTAADSEQATDEQAADAEGNEIIEAPERGLRYHVAREYIDKGISIDPYNYNLDDYPISTITFMGEEANKIISDVCKKSEAERTPEDDQKALKESWKHSGNLLTMVMVEDKKYAELKASGVTPDKISGYPGTKEFKKSNGYTYLMARPEIDMKEFTDSEKKSCAECSKYIDTILSSLEFTQVIPEQTETALGDSVPSFNTVDLNGKTVTQNIFADRKLTVVNIWGTFCGPCIEELPELGKWAGKLPDNTQIIGIVGDIDGADDKEHLELAQKICDKASVSYTNLIPDKSLHKMLKGVVGYPTTFLVDSDGNIIGDPIVGASPDDYKTAVNNYLKTIKK